MKRFWILRWLDEHGNSRSKEFHDQGDALMRYIDFKADDELQDVRLWECTEIQC